MALSLAFLLTGCKSEEAKNTEVLIDNIGTVSLESETLINEAQESYDALTEQQKNQVENYPMLVVAQEDYQKLLSERKEPITIKYVVDSSENIMKFKNLSQIFK